MNNIEQVRESIIDASYALTQVGEGAPHLTLLVMQERLKRLVDLEYALLAGLGEKEKGEQVGEPEEVFITNAELDSGVPDCYWDGKGDLHRKYTHKTITLTMMDGTKKVFRFAGQFQ